jgi:hypothetical protein
MAKAHQEQELHLSYILAKLRETRGSARWHKSWRVATQRKVFYLYFSTFLALKRKLVELFYFETGDNRKPVLGQKCGIT